MTDAPDTTKAPEAARIIACHLPIPECPDSVCLPITMTAGDLRTVYAALSPLPVLGEGFGSSADADTHRVAETAVVGVSPLEIAYGCLWHATTDEKALHEARAHVRRHISHNGQARGIAWALKSLAAPRDDTQPGTEKPS